MLREIFGLILGVLLIRQVCIVFKNVYFIAICGCFHFQKACWDCIIMNQLCFKHELKQI